MPTMQPASDTEVRGIVGSAGREGTDVIELQEPAGLAAAAARVHESAAFPVSCPHLAADLRRDLARSPPFVFTIGRLGNWRGAIRGARLLRRGVGGAFGEFAPAGPLEQRIQAQLQNSGQIFVGDCVADQGARLVELLGEFAVYR